MGDDLDIYNDLDEFQETEQQKSKELEEWEKKFANAQVEINNYQALNKALAKKIKTMEVNFQNLLDTAKAEIKRKDTLIAHLRKEKDDICFRRKGFGPKAGSKRIIENHQQEPQLFKPEETVVASDVNKGDKRAKVVSNPFKQDPRQQPKRFKLDETVVHSDVINKNDKQYKQINDDKQKSEEIVHEKKADHKRGRQSSSEAKSSQERSSSDTKSVHHRDRDRNRSRRRSRSHSRSRSRERCRSRHMERRRNSRAKETQRSRRSRSHSASRSRSSHRTNNNKTSHRNDSREHETKASTNDKHNIQKSMELLFGKTPKPNSPAIELTNEQKAKVLERMLANAEPYTPMEQYTPQSVNRAGSDSTSDKITNKRQSEEEFNSYFLSNVRETEQSTAEATKGESTDQIDCILNDVAKDQAEVESLEHLEDASNEFTEIKISDSTAKNEDVTKRHAIEQTQATSTKAIEQIPPLDLITEDEVESNDQLENVPNDILEINAVINEKQTTKSTENIPDPNVVTKKTEVGSIEQSEEANDIAEINTTKPAAENKVETLHESPNEKEESKVIDIEPETNNTAAENELTKTDDKQATSCSDELQSDDEENTSPIIKAATEREDKLTEFDDANQESKKEFNNCDEQAIACIEVIQTPDQAKDIEDPAIDNNVTPEPQMRSASAVQIIEDIRLPVMMEIEDFADTVDRLSGNEEDLLETKYNNEEHQLNLIDSDKETLTKDMQALKSNVEVVSTTLTPKPSIVTSIVMYAQPDSTKIDHNEVEAVERLILSDEVMAKSLDLSLSFEIDSIELTLEKLHQQSHDDEQPDEATVTSTSMKALKQDLIKILTQSPVQQPPAANVSPSPAKLKSKAKKTGVRSVSERSTPTKNSEHSSATPERVDKTPLKKRKLDLDDKKEDQVVLQTPPDSVKTSSPSPQHVTIDETLNASNSDNNNSSISNSSIVTKRCSLGNSDYQFERINDEVVLRVTRRPRRRRPAPSATVNNK
ncbi:hypothetical protein ACLKA6_017843 [Drosophila palustris]